MKKALLDALEKKYEAEIAEADATVHIYLNNSVGIGEHPQHITELDKLIIKIADAEDKLVSVMAKLCPAGKAAAKRKFKVYPSAYANMWASKYCKGKVGRKKTKKRR
jgi:hypothetical protein